MLKPILVPLDAVDLHTLHVVAILAQSFGFDSEGSVAIDCHVDVFEPRAFKQVYWSGYNRVKTQHLPYEPGVECAGVGVARHAVRCVAETDVM